MDAVGSLRLQLTQLNHNLVAKQFGDIRAMRSVADATQDRFKEGRAPSGQVVLAAIRDFLVSGKLPDFRALKLVSYGLAERLKPNGRCVLDDAKLTDRLLGSVDQLRAQGRVRQFRRCCHGLLSVYLSANPYDAEGRRLESGWSKIRVFLKRWVRALLHGDRAPDWATALNEHENLLTETACARYGKAYLAGDTRDFESACERLGVPRNSWVREQVVLAAIKSATDLNDAGFTQRVDGLLGLLKDAPSLKLQGLALVLNRYARKASRLPHPALQTATLAELGNPLLRSTGHRWTGVSPEARSMVGEWLKARVVEQFFEILSHDGATDKRRVDFWSSLVPVIENIWLVLGPAARSSVNQDFRELRRLMGDQALKLEGSTNRNNAFVMKIAGKYIVEFGEKGNAAYVYDEGSLPFSLEGALHLSQDLKAGSVRHSHIDGHFSWEDKFRSELGLPSQATRRQPQPRPQAPTPPAPTPRTPPTTPSSSGGVFTPPDFERTFRGFCLEHGLTFKDNRPRGGNLIVYVDGKNPKISGTLGQWGFRYDPAGPRWIKY